MLAVASRTVPSTVRTSRRRTLRISVEMSVRLIGLKQGSAWRQLRQHAEHDSGS